ncbi:protein of unknown function [Shinella sp. WSC3-e]|nr:hypothetical protein SHINE37_41218 [Rhizobiaceae bacterium]CAK7255856.1 protein of unknown function [Shinella sp. WSC3-e]
MPEGFENRRERRILVPRPIAKAPPYLLTRTLTRKQNNLQYFEFFHFDISRRFFMRYNDAFWMRMRLQGKMLANHLLNFETKCGTADGTSYACRTATPADPDRASTHWTGPHAPAR